MPLVRRTFYVSCRGEDCNKIAELLRSSVSVEYLDIAITERGLHVTLYGYKAEVRNSWAKIKSLLSSHRSSVAAERGYGRVSLEHLVKKFKHTFPPALLAYILEKMNYVASLSEDKSYIVTSAPLEVVEGVVEKICRELSSDEVKFRVSGTTTKYYVVASSILASLAVGEVLSAGLERGHLYLDEDGKYRLRVEWRRAVEELISQINR